MLWEEHHPPCGSGAKLGVLAQTKPMLPCMFKQLILYLFGYALFDDEILGVLLCIISLWYLTFSISYILLYSVPRVSENDPS